MNICERLKKFIMTINLKKSCSSSCCNKIIIEEECHHNINLTKIEETTQTPINLEIEK
jgi:hypothetical protein